MTKQHTSLAQTILIHIEKNILDPEGALSLSLQDLESEPKNCDLDLTFKKTSFLC